MEAHEIDDVLARRAASGRAYLEFVRHPQMSIGLYVLPARGVDPQSPHTEDEAYYVIEGRGRVTVGDDTRDVGPGSLVYVPARVRHRFHDITDELSILVVFAPAEYSAAEGAA